ncbi:MAG: hypothetical protein U9Q30_01855 [Campylobacterota bacterium]|nr:hypothetical protein [Campylobacterota bacterium]
MEEFEKKTEEVEKVEVFKGSHYHFDLVQEWDLSKNASLLMTLLGVYNARGHFKVIVESFFDPAIFETNIAEILKYLPILECSKTVYEAIQELKEKDIIIVELLSKDKIDDNFTFSLTDDRGEWWFLNNCLLDPSHIIQEHYMKADEDREKFLSKMSKKEREEYEDIQEIKENIKERYDDLAQDEIKWILHQRATNGGMPMPQEEE